MTEYAQGGPINPPPASIGQGATYSQMAKEVRMWAVDRAVELCDTDTTSTVILNVAKQFYDYVMKGTS